MLGEQQTPNSPLFKELNSPLLLTRLVCHNHRIANFLRFHVSLVAVMNCDAGTVLNGFEIYIYIYTLFTHISGDGLP